MYLVVIFSMAMSCGFAYWIMWTMAFSLWCVLARRHLLGAPDAPLATSLVPTGTPYKPSSSSAQFAKGENRRRLS